MKLLNKILCTVLGHNYPADKFTCNTLFFCSRCGKEMFDRKIEDIRFLEPMDGDDFDDYWEYEDR